MTASGIHRKEAAASPASLPADRPKQMTSPRGAAVSLLTALFLATATAGPLHAAQRNVVEAAGGDEPLPHMNRVTPLRSFRIILAPGASFSASLSKIRRVLRSVPYEISVAERDLRILVVAVKPSDMHLLDRVPTIRRIVALDGGPEPKKRRHVEEAPPPPPRFPGPSPHPRRQAQPSAMQRIIVQFSPSADRESEIRRILGALQGLPHDIAQTFNYTPAIVLNVDEQGIERLRRLPGVTLQVDGADRPT